MPFPAVLIFIIAGALANSPNCPGIIPSSSPCNYHGDPAPKYPPATVHTVSASTCYNLTTTFTRYEAIGKATVETQRGCEVLCDSKPECEAFSFKDVGLSSSCVLLSNTGSSGICTLPQPVFLKKRYGCVARTNLMAEFGNDPCIDEIVPSAFREFNQRLICDRSKDKFIFLRAIDASGRRITLDNNHWKSIERVGNAFGYRHKEGPWGNHKIDTTVPIVAAACVRGGGRKCPCAPLKLLNHPKVDKPNYPATIDKVGTCKSTSSWLWWDVVGHPNYVGWLQQHDTANAVVTCKAGMWIVYKESNKDTWGVTGLACYL